MGLPLWHAEAPYADTQFRARSQVFRHIVRLSKFSSVTFQPRGFPAGFSSTDETVSTSYFQDKLVNRLLYLSNDWGCVAQISGLVLLVIIFTELSGVSFL